MKTRFLYLIAGLTFLALGGCEDFFETTIEIDPPAHVPKLSLVGSAIVGDTDIALRLSKTAGILEDDSLLSTVPGAKFTSTLNDEPVTTYPFGGFNGEVIYIIEFGRPLKAGDVLKIKVEKEGFTSIETEAVVPKLPEISNAYFQLEGGKNEEGDEISKFTFDLASNEENTYFTVSANINNVYCQIYDINDGSCLLYDTLTYIELLEIKDPSTINGNYGRKKSGDGFKKNFTCTNYRFYDTSQSDELLFTIYSKPSFDYEVSKLQYYDSNDNPFSTPVNVKSTVINGYGNISLNNTLKIKI